MEAPSLAAFDTEYSADSIEFCPTAGFEHVFVCGTYQLLKPEDEDAKKDEKKDDDKDEEEKNKDEGGSTGKDDEGKDDKAETGDHDADADAGTDAGTENEVKLADLRLESDSDSGSDADSDSDSLAEERTPPAPRVGRLYLFNLDHDTPVEKQRIETAAILDAKWTPNATVPELVVADAKGGLTLYTLTGDDALSQVQRLEVADESTLVLSLDHSRSSSDIITSLSSGELAHIVRNSTGEMEVSSSWAAHDFEPWITAWDGQDTNTLWSGGDDLKLKRWDVRMPAMPTLVNKSFDGGVTTIAPSPHAEHIMAVGSYDARLRIFDTRAPRTPLTEIELPGGIWRTRWHPSAERKGDILNACMHGGFAVVRVDESYGSGEITRTFPGTLGYGADWCRKADGAESIVATCSFYDHVMHLWKA